MLQSGLLWKLIRLFPDHIQILYMVRVMDILMNFFVLMMLFAMIKTGLRHILKHLCC